MCEVHETFPMHLWCRLVAPAELTLNMLRQSNVAPKVSAYAHVHGTHNFMRKPMAPLECPVQCHESPAQRKSCDPHLVDGWTLGTSFEHHRCFKVFVKKTRLERVSGNICIKHKHIIQPEVLPEDVVVVSAQQHTTALQGKISKEHQ